MSYIYGMYCIPELKLKSDKLPSLTNPRLIAWFNTSLLGGRT